MQRDAGADPRLIFVEIDTHHFALAHADKIIHQRWLTIFRPDKHHSDFRFRVRTICRRNERGVVYFFLQNPFVRVFERREFFTARLHVHAQSRAQVLLACALDL